jgi:hypothetical protein
MSVTPKNLVQGPMDIFLGTFDGTVTREPAAAAVNSTPQASAWADMGGTKDGAQLNPNFKYSEMSVDQVLDTVGTRVSDRDLQVKTKLAELTLNNLQTAFNGGTITTGAGFATFDPNDGTAATQPAYFSILLWGYAPSSALGVVKRRMVILRKVLNIESPAIDNKKDAMGLIPVTFRAQAATSAQIREIMANVQRMYMGDLEEMLGN